MNIFLGTSANACIGIGKAFVIPNAEKRIIPQQHITDDEREKHLQRFENSLANVITTISTQLAAVKGDKVQSEIFETYFLMLNDPEFLGEVRKSFAASDMPIEYVLNQKTEEYADRLRCSGNDYLAERAQDICDIFGRVLDDMLDYHPFKIESVPDGAVIVAKTMNPSDTIILSKRKIAGLALIEGGVSSHVGILARSYGIPAVFALDKVTEEIKTGNTVIVDGIAGEVIDCPDEDTIKSYEEKIEKEKQRLEALSKFRNLPAVTKDGVKFSVMANIGTVEEAEIAAQEGADGIGLFRTEFLFMNEANRDIGSAHAHASGFSEEKQFVAYRRVLEIMKGKPVVIRTLDAGGDKIIKSAEMQAFSIEEKNPLMGLRAIRLSLENPNLLKTQFRALYRASVYGNLKIMLPLITSVEQVRDALSIAEIAKNELRSEGIKFVEDVPIGIMVETAAAAMIADCFAKITDFFSIGTNDLTQYTLCVDRENTSVAPMYNEFHLAVLRLISMTVKEAETAGIPVSVCGEMAGKNDSALVLAGMGVRTLSVSSKRITKIKALLSQFTLPELQAISAKNLNVGMTLEII